MAVLSKQPFKGIYLLCAISFELARLPLWILKYITSYGRQNSSWSFRNALGVRIFYTFTNHFAVVEQPTPILLTPGPEKDRWTVMEPADTEYYVGPFAATSSVKPEPVGATWTPSPLTPSTLPDDPSSLTVILHSHGGAYVLGDGRLKSFGHPLKHLVRETRATHCLSLQYRLSTMPPSPTSNPFPAAIQDLLTAYLYLTQNLKIPASNIIVSGDSAGGNATLALLRYLSTYGADLGLASPATAFLWSPWVSPLTALDPLNVSSNENFSTDYLPPRFCSWGAAAYAGTGGASLLASPYIEFIGNPFPTSTKLWCHVGGKEILCRDVRRWVGEMRGVEGNSVVEKLDAELPHDLILITEIVGFEKEFLEACRGAAEVHWEGRK